MVRKDAWNDFYFFEFIKFRFMAQDVKSLVFLNANNEKVEKEIKDTIPFTIATKRIKYLDYTYLKKQKTYIQKPKIIDERNQI